MNVLSTPSRLHAAQFRLARSALAEILELRRPADVVMQSLFRAHPECGSRDRARIGDWVYGVLRDFRTLETVAAGREPASLVALLLLRAGFSTADLQRAGADAAESLAARLAGFDFAALTPAQQLNLPDWFMASVSSSLTSLAAEEMERLAAALAQPASVDVRVNTLKATREYVRAQLAGEGVETSPTPYSPLGLRLAKRRPLAATRAFKQGLIELQDEGSQLLALLVGARPGETIVDYCAGAGGKTLALAAQMQNRGRLIACDVNSERLAKLAPRAQRAGVSSIEGILLPPGEGGVQRRMRERSLTPDPLPMGEGDINADAVLVDAPCSGSGTWRRQPEQRLHAIDLARMQRKQQAILNAAAQLVKPGGRLIYATCSFSAEENEQVVNAFLAAHPQFHSEDPDAALAPLGLLPLATTREGLKALRLSPDVHGTDGFFAALLRRELSPKLTNLLETVPSLPDDFPKAIEDLPPQDRDWPK